MDLAIFHAYLAIAAAATATADATATATADAAAAAAAAAAVDSSYRCNANGTTLSWVEYNVSSCGGCAAGEDECIYDQKRVIGSGNRSVPFESDGFTFGCSCFGDDKFVTMHTYNASADNNGQFAMVSCQGKSIHMCVDIFVTLLYLYSIQDKTASLLFFTRHISYCLFSSGN